MPRGSIGRVNKRTWKLGGKKRSHWQIVYYPEPGKRATEGGFKTQGEANVRLDEIRQEMMTGVHVPVHASGTLAEECDKWIARGKLNGLAEGTMREYRWHVRSQIRPRLGDKKIGSLKHDDIETFALGLLSDCSKPTAKKILTSLKAVLKLAKRSAIARDVTITIGSRHRSRVQIPSSNAVGRLLDTDMPLKLHALLRLLAYSGMRISEARGLTWPCVDLDSGCVTIEQRADNFGQLGPCKSEAGKRQILIPPQCVAVLRAWRVKCPAGDTCFPNGSGGTETYTNIRSRLFLPAMKRAGLMEDGKPLFTLHHLRHWHASLLIHNGTDVVRVAKRLGHESPALTLSVYSHVFDAADKEGRDREAKQLAAMESALQQNQPHRDNMTVLKTAVND